MRNVRGPIISRPADHSIHAICDVCMGAFVSMFGSCEKPVRILSAADGSIQRFH